MVKLDGGLALHNVTPAMIPALDVLHSFPMRTALAGNSVTYMLRPGGKTYPSGYGDMDLYITSEMVSDVVAYLTAHYGYIIDKVGFSVYHDYVDWSHFIVSEPEDYNGVKVQRLPVLSYDDALNQLRTFINRGDEKPVQWEIVKLVSADGKHDRIDIINANRMVGERAVGKFIERLERAKQDGYKNLSDLDLTLRSCGTTFMNDVFGTFDIAQSRSALMFIPNDLGFLEVSDSTASNDEQRITGKISDLVLGDEVEEPETVSRFPYASDGKYHGHQYSYATNGHLSLPMDAYPTANTLHRAMKYVTQYGYLIGSFFEEVMMRFHNLDDTYTEILTADTAMIVDGVDDEAYRPLSYVHNAIRKLKGEQ